MILVLLSANIGAQWTAGDSIALWRAYAVLGRPRWLRIVIGVLLLVELGEYSRGNGLLVMRILR